MRRPSGRVCRAVAAVVLVLGGGVVGYGVSEIGTSQCAVGFALADRADEANENLVIATHQRATRGQSEFAKHEAESDRLWAELDDIRPAYRAAKAACLGDS